MNDMFSNGSRPLCHHGVRPMVLLSIDLKNNGSMTMTDHAMKRLNAYRETFAVDLVTGSDFFENRSRKIAANDDIAPTGGHMPSLDGSETTQPTAV